MKRSAFATVLAGVALLAPSTTAQAQHEGHEHHQHPETPAAAGAASEKKAAASQTHAQYMGHGNGNERLFMASSVTLLDPMSRESSGTAWQPDSSPIFGRMFMTGSEQRDMFMLHGALYPRYTYVGSERGGEKVSAPNWIMGMYRHPLSDRDQIGVRAMLSLDPLTEGGNGYPLLFQTGETWCGKSLRDRQHPHDLFSELSVAYSRRLSPGASAYLYLGLPGEPALGAPAFMHRISASDNPDAPLSHHWQDATHISFGVATLGIAGKNVKIEGSAFNGLEPDENRYDIETPRLNSYSGRFSWNPSRDTAFQVSHGFIKSPERHHPGVNVNRTTASLLYNRPTGERGNWSNALVWGRNNLSGGEGTTDFYLLETNYRQGQDTVYGRIERVEKSGHELGLQPADVDRAFPLNAFTLGYVRDLNRRENSGLDTGLGAQVTLNTKPSSLDTYYGENSPISFQVFFRLRPSRL